jgi:hypothetical protein
MSDESATPYFLELSRLPIEAVGRRDFDEAVRFYNEHSVWDASAMGMGIYRGAKTIRRELEQWTGAYDAFWVRVAEVRYLGNGVVFSITH